MIKLLNLCLASIVTVMMVAGCGVKDTPHFDNEKTFGQIPEEGESPVQYEEQAEEEAELPNQTTPPDAPPESMAATESNNAPVAVVAPANPVVDPPGPEEEFEEEEFEEPEAMGPALVTSTFMKGGLDISSLQFLRKGKVMNPSKIPGVKGLLRKQKFNADIKLWSKVYLDDINTGEGRVVQDAVAPSGDTFVMFGGDSESGKQVLHRKDGGEDCPGSFVCIDRLTWQPTTGSPSTICFVDPSTKRVKFFPYAPNPLYPASQIIENEGTYGAYEVLQLKGDVACNERSFRRAMHSHRFYLRVRAKKLNGTTSYRIQNRHDFKPDVEVTMEIDRYGAPSYGLNNRPYTDTVFKLQGKTVYTIDSVAQQFVKITKKVRKDLRFPRNPGALGLLIKAFNAINPIDGVMLNMQIEFCRDLVAAGPSACAKRGN